jgi:hypothetical protein
MVDSSAFRFAQAAVHCGACESASASALALCWVCFPRLSVRRVGEQGMHERHQEGFDGVEFCRGDGAVMREIVDDAPRMAVVAQCFAGLRTLLMNSMCGCAAWASWRRVGHCVVIFASIPAGRTGRSSLSSANDLCQNQYRSRQDRSCVTYRGRGRRFVQRLYGATDRER